MADKFFCLILGVAYIAGCSFLAYKVIIFALDRMLNKMMTFRLYALVFFIFLSISFLGVGIMMFFDFINDTDSTELANYFPVMFVTSALCMCIGVWGYFKRNR